MTKTRSSGATDINVNLGDSGYAGPVIRVALVGLLVGFLLGAWLMNRWRSFNVSGAYEERVEVLEDRHAAREDSLRIVRASIESSNSRVEVALRESDRLARDLDNATADAADARLYVDQLHAAGDTTIATLLEENSALRQALVSVEHQCSVCAQQVDVLRRGISEILEANAALASEVLLLRSQNIDLGERWSLAQSELDRAGGRWGGWSAFGGPPVAIVGLAALVLLVSW